MYRQKLPKQNTSEFRVFIQSRCIPINFPRFYSLFLEVYPRANQPHFNFPRCCLYSLVAYSRASGDHYVLRGDSIRALSMWQRGLLILLDWGFWGGVWKWFGRMDTSGLPDFMEFRCIFLFDTSESDIFDASRCISLFFRYEFSFFCWICKPISVVYIYIHIKIQMWMAKISSNDICYCLISIISHFVALSFETKK